MTRDANPTEMTVAAPLPGPAVNPPASTRRSRTSPTWPAWLLLAIFAAFAGIWAWPRVVAARHLADARSALATEDFEAVQAHLALARRARPEHPDVLWESARLARREKNYRAAQAFLTQAETAGAPADDIRVEEQLLAVEQGGWQGNNLPLLERLKNGTLHEARIREALAAAYFREYLLLAALEQADLWCQLEPNSGLAWQLAGEVRVFLKDADGSIRCFRTALDRNPNLVKARLGLANSLSKNRLLAEAVDEYELAMKLPPTPKEEVVAYINVLLELGRTLKAEERVAILLDAYPSDPEVLGVAGRVALRAGRTAEAEPKLKIAAAEGGDPAILQDYMQCLVRLRRPDEARVVEARLKQLKADTSRMNVLQEKVTSTLDPAPRVEMGQLMIKNGFKDRGAAWFLDALRNSPNYKPAHRALAEYLTATGRAEDAALHRQLGRE